VSSCVCGTLLQPSALLMPSVSDELVRAMLLSLVFAISSLQLVDSALPSATTLLHVVQAVFASTFSF
jgi:hypothetical protein